MLEIIIGAVVILAILGALFGFFSSASEGKNPISGAAAGAAGGAFVGLSQGCGCAVMVGLAALAFGVGKWILGG